MLYASSERMKQKAERLAAKISRVAPDLAVDTAPSVARSGGGTLPTFEIPSFAVRLGSEDANALAESLRSGNPPVVGRVGEGRLWLDVRTLLDGDEDVIIRALEAVYG
jgi:L-seryl-tRNA(Ser) seleniumtransferase